MSTPAKSRPDEHDLAKRLVDPLAGHHCDVERDRAVRKPSAFVDLGLLRPRDDVARGELHLVGRVALHEPLTLGVQQEGALAARSLGDQKALLGEGGRVVLDHLHVHQRGPDPVGHRDSVAGADQGVGGGLPDLSDSSRGQDHVLRLEQLHGPVGDVAHHCPRTAAVVVEHEARREVLLVAGDHLRVLHQLLVEHVHDRLAGDVRDVVGARLGGAAERSRSQPSLVVAVERDAEVLEVKDLVRGLAAHDLDRVLVAEVVGALDGVECVRLPAVSLLQRGVDAALGSVRVRTHGVDLGDDPDRDALLGRRERGPLAGEPRSDHEYVVPRAHRCGSGRAWASESRVWRGRREVEWWVPFDRPRTRPDDDLQPPSAIGVATGSLRGMEARSY